MSTKIWEAYQLRAKRDLWDTLREIRRRAEVNVRKTLTTIYNEIIADAERTPQRRIYLDAQMPKEAYDYLKASRYVRRCFCQSAHIDTRNMWDLSVSVVVRRASRRRYLLIPYPGSGLLNDSLTFLRRHKALVDYHYQNQADRPSHISARAWNERARTWDPLLADDRWPDKLVLEIVSSSSAGWARVDPAWDLMTAPTAKKK